MWARLAAAAVSRGFDAETRDYSVPGFMPLLAFVARQGVRPLVNDNATTFVCVFFENPSVRGNASLYYAPILPSSGRRKAR